MFEHSKLCRRIVDHEDSDRLFIAAKAVCEPVLRERVRVLPAPFRVMAGYHLGLCDAEGIESAGNSGKGLRPGLVLAAAQACGARSADVVAAAATAVELVHNFTLVHDDVIDGDRTRRGRATVWSRWGPTQA
ncbi:polyprenyl synthetase family protein, partial [Nocardia brasiliensis]|uniref:polyprenyl synthetase family protein n=1 Tax=Nocardia brasiliensis TaxID=37326 RepID=UPI001F1B0D80